MKTNLKTHIANAIVKLPRKQRLVLSLYYVERLHIHEIANVLNLSVAQVLQLYIASLEKFTDFDRLEVKEGIQKLSLDRVH